MRDTDILRWFQQSIARDPSIESIDGGGRTLRVRAVDGRLVTVRIDPHVLATAVRGAQASRSLRDFAGSNDVERFCGLFLVHLAEGINSSGGSGRNLFRNSGTGVEPVDDPVR